MEELQKKIDAIISKLLDYKDNDEICQSIGQIVVSLNSRDLGQWTADELSRAGMKLSLLLLNLSNAAETAKMGYNMSYAYRKFKSASKYLEIQEGTNQDKNMICQKYVNDYYGREVEEEYKAGTLKLLYHDIERIISIMQSRIKYLISEQINISKQT